MDFMGTQNNSILITQSISKLVEKIRSTEDNAYLLKQLKEKCFQEEDVVISLAANQGLTMLVENKTLQFSPTLSELISALPVSRCYNGITAAVFDLLLIDLQDKLTKEKEYKCSFNLRLPQHPLISVFHRYPVAFNDILSKITYFYNNNCDRTFYGNELFYSFFMYIICNPTLEVPELYQTKLWNFLIQINKPQSLNIMPYIITWLQTSSQVNCLKSSCFVIDLIKLQKSVDKDKENFLILWLTSLVYDIIHFKEDPRNIFNYLKELINDGWDITKYASCMLTILAKSILICPSVYLTDLLILCKVVIAQNSCNKFSNHLLKVSLLQWLAHGCMLTTNSVQLSKEILSHIETKKEGNSTSTPDIKSSKTYNLLLSTNQIVYLTVEMNILSESLTDANISNWLTKANEYPAPLLKNMFHFFTALYLYESHPPEITMKLMEILLKIAGAYKECTVHLLTLFLYHLSRESNPNVITHLLKALPKMAVLKENMPLVLNTLESLKKGPFTVKLFSVTLLYDLWEVDNQCYSNLLSAIGNVCESTENITQLFNTMNKREAYITKANILKQICDKKPETHGRELVGHLSDILNKCKSKNGAVATAMAINSIKLLCKGSVIDISSTWLELSPRFQAEKNVLIVKNLCDLMTEAAYTEPSQTSPQLLDNVLTQLWRYATEEDDVKIIAAAFDALACFTLENVSSYLPEKYQTQKSKSDIFGLVQGKSWINLLSDYEGEKLNIVGNFLMNFVRKEISQYRSSTYKVPEGRKEPQNLDYLPDYSMVRELGNYVRIQVQNWKRPDVKDVYLQCLRILSQEYSKPIPHTDWCFLQELIHDEEAKHYCITIAAHQLQLSGTARRLMENYITALANSVESETMKTMFESLKFLCNSIQPMILQPFIENAVNYSLDDQELATTLIQRIKNVLRKKDLHEPNKLVLSQVISETITKINIDSPLFPKLLECVIHLPTRNIDNLISPQLWNNTENFKLSVKIRRALILKENGFSQKWLKDLIDVEYFNSFYTNYIFENVIILMKTRRNTNLVTEWIIELLGHIQSTIANENISRRYIEFLCDIFVISMVTLAGQDLFLLSDQLTNFLEHHFQRFPQSVAALIKMEYWQVHTTQILEWLFHMTTYNYISQHYKLCFYQTLAALRYEATFSVGSKWTKYIGIAPTIL